MNWVSTVGAALVCAGLILYIIHLRARLHVLQSYAVRLGQRYMLEKKHNRKPSTAREKDAYIAGLQDAANALKAEKPNQN